MTMARNYYIVGLSLIAAVMLTTAVAFPYMPAVVPNKEKFL